MPKAVAAPPKITHKFTILEEKWIHANEDGEVPGEESALRMDDDKMCCLGFFALSCGQKPKDIKGVSHPDGIDPEVVTPLLQQYCFHPKKPRTQIKVVEQLVSANDTGSISFERRKEKIAKLFAKIGVLVNFVSRKKKK